MYPQRKRNLRSVTSEKEVKIRIAIHRVYRDKQDTKIAKYYLGERGKLHSVTSENEVKV